MSDFNELSVYRGDYAANKVRWQNTPAWRVMKRARLYETMRVSYANMTGALVSEGKLEASIDPMPKPARSRIPWRDIGETIAAIACVLVVIGVIVTLIVLLVKATDNSNMSDQPFPKWIHPQGTNFYIDPSYAQDKQASRWLSDAEDELCGRLPSTYAGDNDGADLLRTESLPGGALRIVCKPIKDD